MGQGQPRVIIWTTLVELPYTMLHTKFQGHRSIGSGEEDFLRFLPYMGMAAMLVMWPRPFEQLFFPKGPGGCIWNLVAIGPVVSEEKSFEIVDGRRTTDDGRTDGRRTTEPAYTISSPGAFGSGELKTHIIHIQKTTTTTKKNKKKSTHPSLILKNNIKVKASDSPVTVGAVGFRGHCILGLTCERQNPSLFFCCLISPRWVDRESFPVAR